MLFFILVSENKIEENLYQGSLYGHNRTVEYVDSLASVHTNITNIKKKGVQLRTEKLKLFASDIITLVGKSLGIYKVNVYNH